MRVDEGGEGSYGFAVVNKLTWETRWVRGLEKRVVAIGLLERIVIVAIMGRMLRVYCLKNLNMVWEHLLGVEVIQHMVFAKDASMAVTGYKD